MFMTAAAWGGPILQSAHLRGPGQGGRLPAWPEDTAMSHGKQETRSAARRSALDMLAGEAETVDALPACGRACVGSQREWGSWGQRPAWALSTPAFPVSPVPVPCAGSGRRGCECAEPTAQAAGH